VTNESGALHHVELQVVDLDEAIRCFGWLLAELGYAEYQHWQGGRSWRRDATYIVVAQSPRSNGHDRRGAGLNHLAFHAGSPDDVDRLWAAAPAHGWTQLYSDRHPWAGGAEHYAAFIENRERFKVELVASAE
jgi:catechol 2,3-dioxygenase-like lactoylglutathione lyase family enzyme